MKKLLLALLIVCNVGYIAPYNYIHMLRMGYMHALRHSKQLVAEHPAMCGFIAGAIVATAIYKIYLKVTDDDDMDDIVADPDPTFAKYQAMFGPKTEVSPRSKKGLGYADIFEGEI